MGKLAGFTLIEMLVVFSLLFTFSTVGIASYVQFTNDQALDASVGEVSTMLNNARMRAVSQVIPASATGCAGKTLKGYQISLTPWGRDYETDILCGGNVIALNKHKLSDNICFNSSSNGPIIFNVADGTTRPAIITINGVDKSRVISIDNAGNVSISEVATSPGCSTLTPTSTPVPTNTPVPTATSTPVPTATSTPVPTATNTPVPMPTKYEAEYATLAGPIVANSVSGYSGTGYADYQAASGDYAQWTVSVPTAGSYDLKFRYGNGSTGDRPLELRVNGVVVNSSLSFPVTGGWPNWAFVIENAVLNSGTNTVRLTAIGSSGANFDYVDVVPRTPTKYEAEYATLAGPIVANSVSGYSGTGYADYQAASGDYAQWTVSVPTAGSYDLKFRYGNGSTGDRPLELRVNGVVVNSSLSFPVTGGWPNWAFVIENAVLNSGTNTVRLTAIGSSGGNFDYLEL